jgi:DeoR family transcriptional regulator of aga operon
MMVEPLLYQGFRHDSSFREQMEQRADEKRRIAIAAADLIEDGDTIALTPGTTTTEIVRSIRHRSGITVVTNTVNVAMELSQREDLEVVVSGGSLRGRWFSLVGSLAVQGLEQIFTDKVFIGANGIDAAAGLTCHHAGEAGVNRVMVQHAKKKIAVADASKLGTTATHRICGIDAIDLLITDTSASDQAIAPFVAAGLKIRRV